MRNPMFDFLIDAADAANLLLGDKFL